MIPDFFYPVYFAIWYSNFNTLRIIWKFDLNSWEVLGRIYALIMEVLFESDHVPRDG